MVSILKFCDLREAEKSIFKDFSRPYIYKIPEFPINDVRTYSYYSNQIDIVNISCTCKEYSTRLKYPDRDIRRCCKHLAHVLKKYYAQEIGPLTVLLLDNQLKYGVEIYYETEINKQMALLGIKDNYKWINIYMFKESWKCYSYNSAENRWAYKNIPDNPEEISKKLKEIFPILKT